MIPVTVVSISKEYPCNTKNGVKQKVDVSFRGNAGQNYDTSYFIPVQGIDFAENEQVLADIVVNGQYTNLKRVEKYDTALETGESMEDSTPEPQNAPQVPSNNVPQQVWAAKDLRICKMNALSHAIETIKQVFPEKTFDSEGDFIGMATMIGQRYIDWMYTE